VTAQKREERLQDVPISIAVLDGKVLDQQSNGGTLEALARVPAISQSMSDAGGMTQISMRGVAPAVAFGDGSTTVGYYVDGVPFALVRSAAIPNTNDYDMSRIEVLRGPQGTLYGATALNGVVHIITNDADPTQFEAKARVGGAGTDGGSGSYRGDAAVNIPIIADKFAVRVVAGYDHEGGWIDQPNLGRKDANTTDTTSLRVKVDIRPIDNLKIDLAGWYSDERDAAASFGINGAQADTYNPSPSTTDYDAFNARVVYDLPFASLSSSTSYMKLDQNVYTDYDNELPPAQQTHNRLDELYSNLPARVLTEEFLVNSRDPGPWRWQGGAFYRNAYDDRLQTLPALLGPYDISWRDETHSYAIFGQITRSFDDDHFEVTGGLRYFHDSYGTHTLENADELLPYVDPHATAQKVTPRLVFAWLPNSNTNIYATYSVGFRSGLEQSPLILAADSKLPPARPDTLKNYEIGAKGGLWSGLVTYDASVFYIKWYDIQENGELQYCHGTPVICAPLGGTVNGVSASGAGFDLSLALHPLQGLDFGFDVSENDLTNDADVYPNGVGVGPNNGAVYVKGDRTPFSSRYTADVYVDYKWPINDKLDASVKSSGNYRSEELLILNYTPANGVNYSSCNNGNYCYSSGSPTTVDASIEIANHHHQSLALYGTNLTNWNGLLIPSPTANTAFRQRPRTIGMQLEAKF
jgi:outer membrane receptor protein involved in Fe transport